MSSPTRQRRTFSVLRDITTGRSAELNVHVSEGEAGKTARVVAHATRLHTVAQHESLKDGSSLIHFYSFFSHFFGIFIHTLILFPF